MNIIPTIQIRESKSRLDLYNDAKRKIVMYITKANLLMKTYSSHLKSSDNPNTSTRVEALKILYAARNIANSLKHNESAYEDNAYREFILTDDIRSFINYNSKKQDL